jgi:hypothetical protein
MECRVTDQPDKRPVPLDLTRHAALIEGAREFLRVWMRPDGVSATFVNPVPVGADPAGFGAALVDCIRQAARSYARAVNIDETDALARIWQGVDAERGRRTDSPIQFVQRPEGN